MTNLSAIYLRLPNWIGDVCMSLPSLQAVLATGVPVVVCARPWARELLAGYKLAGFIDMKGHWREDRAAVASWRKKNRHLHARGLLLPDSLSSSLVFKFAGVHSAGYRDDGRSLLLRWPIDKPVVPTHAVESWFHLTQQTLKRWGLPAGNAQPPRSLDLKIASRHQAQGREAIAAAGLQPGGFVLIAPTATGLHRGRVKVWPLFDQLTRALQNEGHTVAMCPPPAEAAEAKRNAPTALCLPPMGLGAFATLTRLASVVVCNDSGVSHIAAAANAAQVTLFGVTNRERTGPWSEKAICLGNHQAWPGLDEVLAQTLAFATETVT